MSLRFVMRGPIDPQSKLPTTLSLSIEAWVEHLRAAQIKGTGYPFKGHPIIEVWQDDRVRLAGKYDRGGIILDRPLVHPFERPFLVDFHWEEAVDDDNWITDFTETWTR
jgi:hypothetical protein